MTNKIATYVWIVDTIERYGRITLGRLNELWAQSSVGDGQPLPRRTFFHYRNDIEDMFKINIACDRRTFEYYIEHNGSEADERLHRWLMDSMSISGTLQDSHDVSGRIILENVPSARQHLGHIIKAMRHNQRISFTYKGYRRPEPTPGVVICPYFVKIFKQLWYVIGLNVADRRIKTYALDRMSHLHTQAETFKLPADLDPIGFFKDCFGITSSPDPPADIALRVSPTQAKYFRALPLHPTQQETIHDDYSIFTYHMCITYDLKEELLSHGADVEVLRPQSLKHLIANELQRALEHYQQPAGNIL